MRLDRSLEADRFEAPRETSQFASACAESLPWAVASSYAFRETSHINLQEARALRREIRRLASCFDNAGRIQVCLNDSMVCVFAFSKGRSSSLKLNNILRGLLPYLVMGDVAPALLWIETAANFADHPSRFRPLPPPCVPLGWLQDFGIFGPNTFCGLEVFAGSARITHTHVQAGPPMQPSVDAPPCSSFSPLRNLEVDLGAQLDIRQGTRRIPRWH